MCFFGFGWFWVDRWFFVVDLREAGCWSALEDWRMSGSKENGVGGVSDGSGRVGVMSRTSDETMQWRVCSCVLGAGLLLSLGLQMGPGQAHASLEGLETGEGSVLSIDGFDTVDGVPGFVIVDGSGVRVGTLPMVVGDGE
jgi:hypothetical protein|tara:strand:- start:14 stop:433 length:420 start_codon:yes stop_codon:yes gene_type:complete